MIRQVSTFASNLRIVFLTIDATDTFINANFTRGNIVSGAYYTRRVNPPKNWRWFLCFNRLKTSRKIVLMLHEFGKIVWPRAKYGPSLAERTRDKRRKFLQLLKKDRLAELA